MTRMRVKGTPELRARLKAIKVAFKPIGRQWATSTAHHARRGARFKDRSGKGRRSIRVRNASMKRATVVANYYVAILDRGHKQYTITPKRARNLVFQSQGRTVFARKVTKPASRGLGFGNRAGKAGLRDVPMAEELIKLWNGAA
jgi:hypothetical protein